VIGPFLVPNALNAPPSVIHNDQKVDLDHATAEHWWWVLSQYMKHWAEEKRRESVDQTGRGPAA
jgi:hypothetical protein